MEFGRIGKWVGAGWSLFLSLFWWIFARSPLISGLRLSRWTSLKTAFMEFFFFWLLSSLPIIFAVVVDIAAREVFPELKEILVITGKKIRWGEVFVYVNALTAPGLYVVFKFARDTKKFPNAYGILLWSVFILLVSAVLYSRGEPTPVTIQIGVALYVAALVLRYLTLVYDLLRVDFPKEGRRQEDDLVKSMEGFKGT